MIAGCRSNATTEHRPSLRSPCRLKSGSGLVAVSTHRPLPDLQSAERYQSRNLVIPSTRREYPGREKRSPFLAFQRPTNAKTGRFSQFLSLGGLQKPLFASFRVFRSKWTDFEFQLFLKQKVANFFPKSRFRAKNGKNRVVFRSKRPKSDHFSHFFRFGPLEAVFIEIFHDFSVQMP